MRCFGRAFGFATVAARLALIGLRAEDFAAALRAPDFFSAPDFAAARAFGFCFCFFLAIDVLPSLYEGRDSTIRDPTRSSMQPEYAVHRAQFSGLDQLGMRDRNRVQRAFEFF